MSREGGATMCSSRSAKPRGQADTPKSPYLFLAVFRVFCSLSFRARSILHGDDSRSWLLLLEQSGLVAQAAVAVGG